MNRRILITFDQEDSRYNETTPETVIKLLELRGVEARAREIGPEPQRHVLARMLTRLRGARGGWADALSTQETL